MERVIVIVEKYGTKERRLPVTPAMLRWLKSHLSGGYLSTEDEPLSTLTRATSALREACGKETSPSQRMGAQCTCRTPGTRL